MSETQLQAIKDVIKMAPKLNEDSLLSIKNIMEKIIDNQLLIIDASVNLENMDITEKIMYLDYLTESKETRKTELSNSLTFEEILKREGFTYDDLQKTSL